MSSFLFNTSAAALSAGTLTLSGIYYAHLVLSIPSSSVATVAGLALPSNDQYALVVLTGLQETPTYWTFAPFQFGAAVYPIAPVGVVICKQVGAQPAPSDINICYSDLSDFAGATIMASPGNYPIQISFGADGAILK